MIINHNMNALNAHRMMSGNTVASGKSMEKLSSGLRINRAGDDAAGLAISEKMRAQVRGLDQASRNAQDGISMIQTAEGALNETQSILQRMRELATQASNDTNTTEDRGQIQNEINQLTSEINRIGNTTEFNTQTLMSGDFDFKAAKAGKLTATQSINAGLTISANTNDTAGKVTTNSAVKLAPTTGGAATETKIIGSKAVTAGDAVDGTKNELTLSVGGTDVTVTVAAAATTLGSAVTDLNTKLAASNAKLSIENGKLVVSSTATGATAPKIEVKGGNFGEAFIDLNTNTSIAGTDNGTYKVGTGSGAVVTGKAFAAVGTAVTINDMNNELTIKVDGTNHTVNLAGTTAAPVNINADAAARTTFLNDLNTKLNTALGGAKVTASFDTAGKLTLTGDSTVKEIGIAGGNAVGSLFGTSADIKSQKAISSNNEIGFSVDGAAVTITAADGEYASIDEFVDRNKAAFDAKGVVASVGTGADTGKLVLTSKTNGANSGITNIKNTKLAQDLGLVDSTGASTTTATAGGAANTSDKDLSLTINGKAVTVTFADGNTAKDAIVTKMQTAIDAAQAKATVSVNADGKLEITNNETGKNAEIVVNGTNDEVATALGLNGLKAAGVDAVGSELKFQIGANKGQAFTITMSDMRSKALGISGSAGQDAKETGATFTKQDGVTNGTTNVNEESALDISTHESATAAIKVVNDAINTVSTERSKLGAYQNRLEHTIANLGTSSENLTAAESRIRDVDMAKEMMTFSKNNILSQAAQAMLAQANQQPQGVLQLLR